MVGEDHPRHLSVNRACKPESISYPVKNTVAAVLPADGQLEVFVLSAWSDSVLAMELQNYGSQYISPSHPIRSWIVYRKLGYGTAFQSDRNCTDVSSNSFSWCELSFSRFDKVERGPVPPRVVKYFLAYINLKCRTI